MDVDKGPSDPGTEILSAEQFIKSLRSPQTEEGTKVDLAERAWKDGGFYLPRKGETILEWCLERLTRVPREKEQRNDNSFISRYWLLVNSILTSGLQADRQTAASKTLDLTSVISKTSPIPILNSIFTSPTTGGISPTTMRIAVECFRMLLPLVVQRVTLEAMLECHDALLKGIAQLLAEEVGEKGGKEGKGKGKGKEVTVEELSKEWIRLGNLFLRFHRKVIVPTSVAKKVSSHYISISLPCLLQLQPFLSVPPESSSPSITSLIASIREIAQISLFSVPNLQRLATKEHFKKEKKEDDSEVVEEMRKLVRDGKVNNGIAIQSLPTIFSLFVTQVRNHSNALYPLSTPHTSQTSTSLLPTALAPAPSEDPSTEPSNVTSTSNNANAATRSAQEVHSLTKSRQTTFAFLRSSIKFVHEQVATQAEVELDVPSVRADSVRRLVEVVEVNGMYASNAGGLGGADGAGQVEVLREIAGRCSSALESVAGGEKELCSNIQTLTLIQRLDPSIIQPILPRILVTLSKISPPLQSFPPDRPSTAIATTSYHTSLDLLSSLLSHHSKLRHLPKFINLLKTAASSTGGGGGVLVDPGFLVALGRALEVSATSEQVGDILDGFVNELENEEGFRSLLGSDGADSDGARAKKRRKKDHEISDAHKESGSKFSVYSRFVSVMFDSFPSKDTKSGRKVFRTSAKKVEDKIVRPFYDHIAGLASRKVDEGARGLEAIMSGAFRISHARAKWRRSSPWVWRDSEGEGRVVVYLVEVLKRGGEKGDALPELCVEVSRNLLQAIENGSVPTSESEIIFDAVLGLLGSGAPSTGASERLTSQHLSDAVLRLLCSRWLGVFDALATDAQLHTLASRILSYEAEDSRTSSLEEADVLRALLSSATFFELPRLRESVVSFISFSMSSNEPMLASRILSRLALFPREYLGRGRCRDLFRKAVALASRLDVELGDDRRLQLKRTAKYLSHATETMSTDHIDLLAPLVRHRPGSGPVSSEELNGDLDLIDRIFSPVVRSWKSPSVPPSTADFFSVERTWLPELTALQSPIKKARHPPNPDWIVTAKALQIVMTELPDASQLSTIHEALQGFLTRFMDRFVPALQDITKSVKSMPDVATKLADFLPLVATGWRFSEWIGQRGDFQHGDAFEAFSRAATSSIVRASQAHGELDTAVSLGLLDLLQVRAHIAKRLSGTDEGLLEAFVACHIALRPFIVPRPYDTLIARHVRTVSLTEYGRTLGMLESALTETSDVRRLRAVLDTARLLICDGPEGSSQEAALSFSIALRHVTTIARNHSDSSVALDLCRFVEGVLSGKPMLVGSLDVACIFSFFATVSVPPTTAAEHSLDSPPTAVSSSLASEIFSSLVSILSLLVRHRRSYVIRLFPQLIDCISSLASLLRRSGFRYEGHSAGKRVEREAASKFPNWVWSGGPDCLGKEEAKALGRLLANLTTKSSSAFATTSSSSKDVGSLSGPLSKHAPFLLLPVLRYCTDPLSPIPSHVRSELLPGIFSLMGAMGKYEKEALMGSFLGKGDETERALLRSWWKEYERDKYKGQQ